MMIVVGMEHYIDPRSRSIRLRTMQSGCEAGSIRSPSYVTGFDSTKKFSTTEKSIVRHSPHRRMLELIGLM